MRSREANDFRIRLTAAALVPSDKSPANASHPKDLPGTMAATRLVPKGVTDAVKLPWLSGVFSCPP